MPPTAAVSFEAVPPTCLTIRNSLECNLLIRVGFYESVHLCNTFSFLPLFWNLRCVLKCGFSLLTHTGGPDSLSAVVERVPCLCGHCLLFAGVVFTFPRYLCLLNIGVQSEGHTGRKGTLHIIGSFPLALIYNPTILIYWINTRFLPKKNYKAISALWHSHLSITQIHHLHSHQYRA